jgi:hypothetical protein
MIHYEERVPESSIEILGHLVGGIADRHDDLERATLIVPRECGEFGL